MKNSTKITIFAIIVIYGAYCLGVLSFSIANDSWVGLFVVVALVAFAIFIVQKYRKELFPVVDEMQVAVVRNRWNGQFLYFMDETGRYTIKDVPVPDGEKESDYDEQRKEYIVEYKVETYRHAIAIWEKVQKETITKLMANAEGTEELRTKDGIVIDMTWGADTMLFPTRALPAIQHKAANVMSKFADKLLAKRVKHQMRLIIAEKTAEELYLASKFTGEGSVIAQLEAKVRDRAQGQLVALGYVLPDNAIRLGPMKFREEIENQLMVVYRRHLEAQSLKILRESLDEFDDSYVDRYKALERLRIIEKKPARVYMVDSPSNGNSKTGDIAAQKTRTHDVEMSLREIEQDDEFDEMDD